MKYLANDKHSP